ncbi:hypothetical protein GQ54DRAFT_153470 [Martensiomyces pterosporus]|nr:hypothetical protein GQ54DRAFT_153470 [Martensiomyces pterosporus]
MSPLPPLSAAAILLSTAGTSSTAAKNDKCTWPPHAQSSDGTWPTLSAPPLPSGSKYSRIRASRLWPPRRAASGAILCSTTTCADATRQALKIYITSRNVVSALMSSWIEVLFASGAPPRNADHAAEEWLLIKPLPPRCLGGDMCWPKKGAASACQLTSCS